MTMTHSPNPHKFPKGRRRPSAVNFVMTERDMAILEALGRYRYLRTGQISRLVFPQNATVQSARRRLKYLYHAGYIGRIQPLENSELGVGEIAYFLEKLGRELFNAETLPVFSLKSQVKPLFLRHALAVSEFKLNWTLAAAAHSNVELHRVVIDSELKQRSDELVGRKRYKLFDELLDPIGKRKLIVHPDLLIIMRAEMPSKKPAQRLFLVEVDQGTEGLRTISDKLTGYHLYRREQIFKKFGNIADFRVLVQTTSEKRAKNIAAVAKDFGDVLDVWVTHKEAVSTDTILSGNIWLDASKSASQRVLR